MEIRVNEKVMKAATNLRKALMRLGETVRYWPSWSPPPPPLNRRKDPSGINLKPVALQRLVDEMVRDVGEGGRQTDRAAIHIEGGFQVHIVVTSDKDEFMGEVYAPYAEAEE